MSLQSRVLLRAGKWLKNTGLNPARWTEGLGHQLGFRMREKIAPRLLKAEVQAVKGSPQIGTAERTFVDPFGNTHTIPKSPDFQAAIDPVAGSPAEWGPEVPYLSRPLTGAGMAMQGLGYAGLAGGVGTLGYNMLKGDGTEPSHDANGVANPAYNEEMAKFRSQFQQKHLAGDKLFSGAKYRALRQKSSWVDTAIEQIGVDNYKQLKQQLAEGKLKGGAAKMHSILTDAIAETGDEEALKQAGTEPYVLPGLATVGKSKRVIVMAPMKGKSGNDVTMQAMKYGIHDDQENQQDQQQPQQ